MIAFLVILVILLVLAATVFTATIRFHLRLRWDRCGVNAEVSGLYPLFRATIKFEDYKPWLSVYLFKLRIFKKQIKAQPRKRKAKDLIQSIKPTQMEASIHYGLEPHITGFLCGAFGALRGLFRLDKVRHFPDFLACEPYIYIDASANINIGQTITNIIRNKP